MSKKSVRLVVLSAILLGVISLSSLALAADKAPAKAAAGKQAPATAQQAQPAVQTTNAITQAAVKAGVLTCAERINQVSNFLTTGSNSGVFLFVPTADPDKRMFSASLEIQPQAKDASPVYASMSFAPNQANGCGCLYETVSYWDKSPDELIKAQFPKLKKVGVLYKNITVLDAGQNVRIFIMPAGKGCVSIKKEVLQ